MAWPAMAESHRVLIVDDEPAVRWTLALTFQRAGIETDVAENGREAISLLKRASFPYCAAILDLNIPGVDGVEVAKFIRDTAPTLPVVAISGFPDLAKRLETEGLGLVVKLTVSKPVDGNQILNYVHGNGCIRLETEPPPTPRLVDPQALV